MDFKQTDLKEIYE